MDSSPINQWNISACREKLCRRLLSQVGLYSQVSALVLPGSPAPRKTQTKGKAESWLPLNAGEMLKQIFRHCLLMAYKPSSLLIQRFKTSPFDALSPEFSVMIQ